MTMDIRLKERLVGAAVLVLAAVLFIPMVLDGPTSNRQVSQSVELPSMGDRKTVRIALDAENDTTTRDVQELSAAQRDEPATVDLTPKQEAARDLPSEQPQVTATKAPEKQPAKSASSQTREADAPWTVQLGSFSKDDNAETLAAQLRELGYPAYVSRFNDGERLHYRVRVGGFPSRDAAQVRADELRAKTGEPARPVQNQ